MSVAAAVSELLNALTDAGLRVAVRDGDITPPVVYIRIGTVGQTGIPLSGGQLTLFYVYVIPVRGVDNLASDAALLDQVYAAVEPLAWTEVTATNTSLTARNDSWPAYRLDVSVAGLSTTPAADLEAADGYRR